MYLSNLSYSTASKNKLEESFYEYLKDINRTEIQNNKIEDFKIRILKAYELLCEQNSRCKPIKKDFGNGHSFPGDFILYGSNATFTLLKSKL